MTTKHHTSLPGKSSLTLLLILALFLGACQPGIKEREIADLKTKNAEMLKQMLVLQSKTHLQQTEIDSLLTIINKLEQQVANMSGRAPAPGEDEQAIRKMVHNMHTSWKELVITREPQEILQYFMPMFMANRINIGTANKGRVAAYTDLDYHKFLEEIIARKNFGVEFGDVTFLDIAIKDREFFNVAYKCHLREYKKHVLSETSIVMVSITGRKINDNWKIANYSVVSFEYTE